MMNNPSGIEPIGGYLVIQPDGGEEKVGSIFIPESTAEKDKYGSQSGTVLAVADDVRWGLSPGKKVLFGRYAGTMLKGVDGKDYRLVLDEHVKGIYA